MTAESGSGRGLPWRTIGSVVALAAAAVGMFLATPDKTEDPNQPLRPQVANSNDQLKAEKELARILLGMEPGTLDVNRDRLQATDDLNIWLKDFPLPEKEPALTDDAALREKLLSGLGLETVNADRAVPADVAHIRMSLLARETVEYMTRKHPRDLDRMAALFEFVVRHVSGELEQQPITAFEAFLFGKGTVSDRVWCFAELMRQMHFDTVLVLPKSDDPQKSQFFLIGVISDDQQVYLFEPRFGVPVFDPEVAKDSAYPELPVTLAQARENPEILKQFDLPNLPYTLSAEDLKQVRVLLVGSPSQWAPRMARVEVRLPVETRANLYSGLGENRLRSPGAYQRVVEAGEKHQLWTEENVRIWTFPFKQEQALAAAFNDPNSYYQQMLRISSGPLILARDPETGQETMRPARSTIHEVRVEQLTGRSAVALGNLFPIRTAAQSLRIQENLIAEDIGAFLAGQCQLESGQYEAAQDTLSAYLTKRQSGMWGQEAIDELAHCLRIQGKLPEAFGVLNQSTNMTVRRGWLILRWARLLQDQGVLKLNPEPTAGQPAASAGESRPPVPPLPERIE